MYKQILPQNFPVDTDKIITYRIQSFSPLILNNHLKMIQIKDCYKGKK